MTSRFRFRCIGSDCGGEFETARKLYQCPNCGELLDIVCQKPEIAPSILKRQFRDRKLSSHPLDVSGVWRFRELLPFDPSDHSLAVTLGEGNTPVLAAPQAARYAGLKHLKIKHLGWNPTGSFKDYGMTVAATQARKLGSRIVACASTGNTSASMAAYCARTDTLKAVVFIPEGQIAYGKLSQTLDYGALTIQIEGDFDAAMKLVRQLSDETDLYLMNSINPFRLEGQKTVVFELLEQLEWRIPDRIVVPGGNLGNISSFGKGLMELRDWGFIEKVPRLTVVQASGAAPLHQMLASGSKQLEPQPHASTRATAIKIGNPVSWRKALRGLELSSGECESVGEQQIADAKAVLGRDGIGCEPASATTVAGLKKLVEGGRLDPNEQTVAILTGHQLKDSEYTVEYHLEKLRAPDSAGPQLTAAFGNRPVRAAADKDAILGLLRSL